jgi:HEAT repeat protein
LREHEKQESSLSAETTMGLWFIKPDIKRLSEQGDVARLVRALRHRNSTIRKNAADALGKLEAKTAV